jgi:hypothetical protein
VEESVGTGVVPAIGVDVVVGVDVGVEVGVDVGVEVGVDVGVEVGVEVDVGVGVAPRTTPNAVSGEKEAPKRGIRALELDVVTVLIGAKFAVTVVVPS